MSLTLVAATAPAIGPTLPAYFDDSPDLEVGWKLPLVVDRSAVSAVRVVAILYLQGEILDTRELDVALPEKSRKGTVTVDIPLRFDGARELESGAYAQKIIVEASVDSRVHRSPIHIERWTYFLVSKGDVSPISSGKYSALADSPALSDDDLGRKELVHIGGDIKAEKSAEHTEHREAGRIGRHGGLIEEDAPPPRRRKQIERGVRKQEANER